MTDMRRRIVAMFLIVCVSAVVADGAPNARTLQADVCVYGGTASGIAAALAAVRRGRSVIIIEPFRHLGGIAGGGIRIKQDCMYYSDIGGIAKELHDADMALGGSSHMNQWKIRLMLKKKCDDAGIKYFTHHRLDSAADVVKRGSTIEKIYLNYAPVMKEGAPPAKPAKTRVFAVKANVYIDASYEGDLMAFAGSDYTTGREARSKYNESLGGQRGLKYFDVDPYVVPGDPKSGVLPMITTEPYEPGAASKYMIAYNFRLQWVSRGGTPVKPLDRPVDRKRYALAIRAIAKHGAGGKARRYVFWPHTNYARSAMISSGPPSRQLEYPDGDWATRSEIWRDWIDHVKTMNVLVGMKNPQLRSGEYPDNNDFPDQLYTRMGRRMIGRRVMTQQDLMHQTVIKDSIGLAYYAVDIYPPRLIAHDGKVASEGEIFMRVSPGPYQISYRALTPKPDKCDNLLVSVCMSASHVAMASIRMESSYVVMGEAAGIAAAHCVKSNKNVHQVDVPAIQADMKTSGVVIEWNGKGYGPGAKRHWSSNAIWWRLHPEEYKKIPLRLDESWTNAKTPSGGTSKHFSKRQWSSRAEWNRDKGGWEWLFPHIDTDNDGKISPAEYQAFQDYKKKNPKWRTTLRKKRQGT
ncbi:MAG: FAD-dependent oxidoreductase [Phycisphaerae bacterium]|jgi:ribulose 1,5-bisphosphate synthetase/thiazole synthase|nr:FAD-dependent oxidoreductase [Phycisphaerae bacterium]